MSNRAINLWGESNPNRDELRGSRKNISISREPTHFGTRIGGRNSA